jgi:hypothetical protein
MAAGRADELAAGSRSVRSACHAWRPFAGAHGCASRLPSPLQDKLKENSETSQTTAEQNSSRSAGECSKANRLDILPRDDVREKVGRHFPRGKTKQAAHGQAHQRGNGRCSTAFGFVFFREDSPRVYTAIGARYGVPPLGGPAIVGRKRFALLRRVAARETPGRLKAELHTFAAPPRCDECLLNSHSEVAKRPEPGT